MSTSRETLGDVSVGLGDLAGQRGRSISGVSTLRETPGDISVGLGDLAGQRRRSISSASTSRRGRVLRRSASPIYTDSRVAMKWLRDKQRHSRWIEDVARDAGGR